MCAKSWHLHQSLNHVKVAVVKKQTQSAVFFFFHPVCMHFIFTSTTQQFCDDFCHPALTWSAHVSLQIPESVTLLSGSVPSTLFLFSFGICQTGSCSGSELQKGFKFKRPPARGERQCLWTDSHHCDCCKSSVCSKPENVSLVLYSTSK